MKLLLLLLQIFFSSPVFSFPVENTLFCSDQQKRFSLNVDVLITDQENYYIYLTDQSKRPMAVQQSKLTFNSLGEMISISTSANVQLLELKLNGNIWKGEFWFDNSRFNLECKINSFMVQGKLLLCWSKEALVFHKSG